MHDQKIFVTLTYSPEKLPTGGTLVKKHFQDFMKRLRKKYGKGIRYFHCGEYGESDGRPHYHALLYGLDFADKKFHTKNNQGDTLYKSETLDNLWSHGYCLLGAFTYETAAYCARYIIKKVTGEKAKQHYQTITTDGEIIDRQPEYITMSLKPAIGSAWYDKYKGDLYPDDFAVMRGKKAKVPRYYDKKLAAEDEKLSAKLRLRRIRQANTKKEDNTDERLRTKEIVKKSQVNSLLKRSL